jgi:hypothetical protein
MQVAVETDAGFAALVGHIYDCALDSGLWPSALEKMCGAFSAVHGKLAVIDSTTRTARLSAEWGGDSYWTRLAETKYVAIMPHLRVLHKFDIDQPVNIDVIDSALVGERFRESEFYRDWCIPAG